MMTETSFWELIWRGWLLPKPWLLYEFIKWYFGNLKSSGKWLLINKVVELFSYLQWWGLCSPCAGRSPWGVGESSQSPGRRKGHFCLGSALKWAGPRKAKHLSKSEIGNESWTQNKAHCWVGLRPVAAPQFIPLKLSLHSLLFFMDF